MTKPVIHDCISIGEVKKLIDSGAAIRIIDVRSPTEYETRHIGGAENIPLDQLAGRLGELTGASLVVTVCGKGGGRSATGSGLVNEAGHSPAAWLCGGTDAWYA
ncbi:MAG: rhodanese-like domain-containing protein [Cyclobacteriaceae bacterium]|nr:rhodanese-like domain-containing protein [Cyclobacteriaceae bacterium]